MTGKGLRRMVAALTMVAGAVASPVFATNGTDQPQPCAVTYGATPHGAGRPIATTFAVSCVADAEWEVTSIEQQTTLRDTTAAGTVTSCHQQVPGTSATQTCSVMGVRLHSYLAIFRLKVWGNYAVCLDDGTCDSLTPVEDPACVRMVADSAPAAEEPSLVLDCTYRQVVTVGT